MKRAALQAAVEVLLLWSRVLWLVGRRDHSARVLILTLNRVSPCKVCGRRRPQHSDTLWCRVQVPRQRGGA